MVLNNILVNDISKKEKIFLVVTLLVFALYVSYIHYYQQKYVYKDLNGEYELEINQTINDINTWARLDNLNNLTKFNILFN